MQLQSANPGAVLTARAQPVQPVSCVFSCIDAAEPAIKIDGRHGSGYAADTGFL